MSPVPVSRRAVLSLGMAAGAGAGAGSAWAQAGRAGLGTPPLVYGFSGRAAVAGAFTDRRGREQRISDFRGRVVLVNLWATWCGPCRIEMPSLDRLASAFAGDLTVLPVSFDGQGWPAVDEFWGERFAHLKPYLAKDSALTDGYGALGLPFSVLIDRQGREVARLPRAAEWDRGSYRAAVAKTVLAPRLNAATAAGDGLS